MLASILECHPRLSISLLLPPCFYPLSSLYHCIHLSILLPSAPRPFHPSIPPTPCALTALSLDGSSSSKAVTMMDYRLPHPFAPPLPLSLHFALPRSALAIKALTRSQCGICSTPVRRWHCPGHGRKGRRWRVSPAAPLASS